MIVFPPEIARLRAASRLLGSIVLGLALAACHAPVHAPAPEPVIAAAPALGGAPEIVLVAGDSSISAFDNAVDYLADVVQQNGLPPASLHKLSAHHAHPGKSDAGKLDTILETIRALHPSPGGSCIVYLTSHGAEEHGFYLEDDDFLTPSALDSALGAGCAAVPTVVVVSACYSGQFIDDKAEHPNRIVITASSADRSSFGCESGATFTFFDECFLGAIAGAADWDVVLERTRGCVGVREREIDALPSEPQSVFGADVRKLPVPAVLATGTSFVTDDNRFALNRVPLRQSDRKRLQKDLLAFSKAAKPKALALVPNGLAVWTDRAASGTDDLDAIGLLALQRCEFLSGGACVLYAENDNALKLLPSGMAEFHPTVLVREGALQPDNVPFVRKDDRHLVAEYGEKQGPKALALDPTGSAIGLGYGSTVARARDDALAQCESKGDDCVVYAEDNEVVLGWHG